MKKLNDIISEEKIDMIIMDIEGYEINAIKGATNILKKTNYFYVEYAPEQLNTFGMKKEDFIDSIKDIYTNMYILSNNNLIRYENKSWINHLENLPERRGLLLNLLFSNKII